jgi:putative drug exporter of the RND superfamily
MFMTFAHRYTQILHKGRWPILLFWILVTLSITVIFAPNFFNVTIDEFNPPDGTDAANAILLYDEYFAERSEELAHLILVHNPNGAVLGSELQLFTFLLVNNLIEDYPNQYLRSIGYYIFANTTFDQLKSSFISEDNQTALIVVELDGNLDFQNEIVTYIRDFRDDFVNEQDSEFQYYVTGAAELQYDTNQAVQDDLKNIDVIIVPLVLLALIIILRNWKYFPITLLPITMTVGITFGLLERYIVLFDATIQSFVPSALISLTLGIGVDYNLFLLSRFREERLNGRSVIESVSIMLEHAGHTIFTSGLTLCIALSGLAFFPISILSSIGVGITLSILVLLALNLSFTPVILLIFGRFIEKQRDPNEFTKAEKLQKIQSGYFYKVGKAATKYRYIIILVVLLATLPIAFQILQTTPESETIFLAPRGSESGAGFLLLEDNFGSGVMGPFYLLLAPESGNIFSEQIFDLLLTSAVTISNIIDEIDYSNINSIATLGGNNISHTAAVFMTSTSSPFYNSSEAIIYRSNIQEYINEDQTATLLQVILPLDPWSPAAKEIVETIIDALTPLIPEDVQFGFLGTTVVNASILNETYLLFPIMILLVVFVIYTFIGIMYRAVFLPARLIATVGLTVSFIYGAATIVFEYTTILNDFFPFLSDIDVIFWMVPVMSFSVIMGLGIDYDIFTIERIRENTWKGMENNEAIAQGISKTASVITGAGVIMIIAFGGLLFSSSYILVQFGFVLTFAVLLEIVVVRTLLVPSMMSIAKKWNWWPNQPPEFQRKE